jgi:Asp-tRNA(Asn)/Glu-tRNA(Gln) amidotransferase A subunit family amidase
MIFHSLMHRDLIEDLRANAIALPEFLAQVESRYQLYEPSIQAFVPEPDRFRRLSEDAETLVFAYPDLVKRSPLFGAIVGVKDIFQVEGFTTQAGSRVPAGLLQGVEAESVTRLKSAGALIAGKTVTTEFAYFSPGATRNPHNLEHTPGGSSSGSAAAVAAGFCHLALGTQTIGSIVRPAAFCGVVGLKPTYERISRAGVIPLSPSFDHVGFFVPDVESAIHAARVLYRDWEEVASPKIPVLGIPEGPYLASASDYALARFDKICRSLAEAGYELRRVRIMEDFPAVRDRHDVIMSAEAAQVHKAWFEKHANLYSPKFTELIKRGQAVTNAQLHDAFTARDKFRASMSQAMNDNNIDLWICPPTTGPAPQGLESTGDPVMNLPWTQIGFPAINLPAGKNEDNLPMGLQVVGDWNMDEALLFWSANLEKIVSKL